MPELGILELQTEHAELLPEREALGGFHHYPFGGFPTVHVTQVAVAQAYAYYSPHSVVAAAASNSIQ
jgi:hypothetical protein